IRAHRVPVRTMAFSPDGSAIASGGGSGILFDTRRQAEAAGGTAVQGVPTARTIGEIKGWDAHSGVLKWEHRGGNENLTSSVVFTSSGRELVSGGSETRLWSAEKGELRRTFSVAEQTDAGSGFQTRTTCLAVSPDERFILTGGVRSVDNRSRADIRLWSR